MTPRFQIRSLATTLLHVAAKIAPPQATEWAHAMVAELHHIEGDWSALAWSIGSAGVLTKHAIFNLFAPNHALSEAPFFAKEKLMRKSTAIAAAVCIAASLLFFAAPTFREAFQLPVAQWRSLIGSLVKSSHDGFYFNEGDDDEYAKIAEQSEKNHDAEGLAFAALHRGYDRTAAAWADEAVRMNPQLTWVYAVMATGRLPRPDVQQWISQLEQFDPQNALPHLIQADIVAETDVANRNSLDAYLTDPAWLSDMSVAFNSQHVDGYTQRVEDLNHRVSARYGLYGPYQTERDLAIDGVVPNIRQTRQYAQILLQSGDALEASGDRQGAEKQYRMAAHFGEMIQLSGRAATTPLFAILADEVEGPYGRLSAFYEKSGDKNQAEHFATLATNAHLEAQASVASYRQSVAPTTAETRNAHIVSISGLAMFCSIGILTLCIVITLVKSRSIQLSNLRAGLITRVLAGTSVSGLLISTAALYLSYRPYAQIIRAYVHNGDASRIPTLVVFLHNLEYSGFPPTRQALYSLWNFPVYFWGGVIVLCFIAVIFAGARFAGQHYRPTVN